MLASLLTEGQLPSGTSASLSGLPETEGGMNDSSTASMTLAELIHVQISTRP